MTALLYDMSSDDLKHYPQHGWAKNTQDIALLRLPIRALMNNPLAFRESKGIKIPYKRVPEQPSGNKVPVLEDEARDLIVVARAFNITLGKLALALTELHILSRKADEALADPDETRWLDFLINSEPMIHIFIDSVFIYLGILADRLAQGLKPILFENYFAAPNDFKGLREHVNEAGRLKQSKPLVDLELLRAAFRDHSLWYDKLRSDTTTEDGIPVKGIRDAIMHSPTDYATAAIKENDDRWKHVITLFSPSPRVPPGIDIISTIKALIDDFCALLTGICTSLGQSGSYVSDDTVIVLGRDYADVVGFWPALF